MSALVILGTGRDDSNTLAAVRELCPFKDYELIQLHQFKINKYSYASNSDEDDFFSIMDKALQVNNLIFATPVYWYAMSGELKVFFDRLTDLITTKKQLGRALKGKNIYIISTGTEPTLPDGFTVPFKRTADYFDMKFKDSFYKRF